MDALEQAGIAVERLWSRVKISCPYRLFEALRRETERAGGLVEGQDFGAEITLEVRLPQEETEGFLERVRELSGGKVETELRS